MSFETVSTTIGLLFLVWILWQIIRSQIEERIFYQYCDAGEAFDAWRRDHPNSFIKDWPSGRDIAKTYLDACQRAYRFGVFEEDKDHITWLTHLTREE